MRVLVCGGRDYRDKTSLYRELDNLDCHRSIDAVIHGGASGADTLAGIWAKEWGCQVSIYPADWQKHGRAAGPIRNQQMLDEGKPDLVVAFPGGNGTADMVHRARVAGVRVIQVE